MPAAMTDECREFSREIKEVLGLKGSPVAVIYAWESPKGVEAKKCRVCDALLSARSGQVTRPRNLNHVA